MSLGEGLPVGCWTDLFFERIEQIIVTFHGTCRALVESGHGRSWHRRARCMLILFPCPYRAPGASIMLTLIVCIQVLISFTVTAVLCAIYCKFYQFLLLWPMRKRDPKTGNKTSGHKFPILTGASLSLQGSLLFLGYALFGAAHIKRCQLTTYHVKLLSKLFIVIFSSVFNSAMSTAYICLKSWGRENRGLRRVRVSLIVRCVSAVALVALLATSVLFLASTETPKFNQPAMAVPGYCFAKKYFEIKSQVEDLIGHNYTDLILGLVAMVSAIAYFILAILKNQRRMKAETPGSRWILRFATVILIALNLGYNTVILVRLWNEWQGAQAYLAKNTSEKEWGFGQIVPVIMLINPILSLLDALTGRHSNPPSYASCNEIAPDGNFSLRFQRVLEYRSGRLG